MVSFEDSFWLSKRVSSTYIRLLFRRNRGRLASPRYRPATIILSKRRSYLLHLGLRKDFPTIVASVNPPKVAAAGDRANKEQKPVNQRKRKSDPEVRSSVAGIVLRLSNSHFGSIRTTSSRAS